MASTQLQDRLAALKQKLKASEAKAKLPQVDVLSRSDTGRTEDVDKIEAAPAHSQPCDSPMKREPLHSAQLDSETGNLQAKVSHLEACVKDHEMARHRLQADLDAAHQKLTLLKEQLMTSQTDAEESGRMMVEETANELEARHANELQRMNAKLQEQQRLIQQLEEKAAQQASDLQRSVEAKNSMQALQKRLTDAESAAKAAQQNSSKLEAERNNLEAVIGELTYEAERVQKLELSMCQAQDEARQANEAAYHAQGLARGAQAEAEHEKKRAAELQLRCLQLEQQLASLGSEMLTLQNRVEHSDQDLAKWRQSSISPEDRDSIVAALLSLCKGENDTLTNLERIGELLKVSGSDLDELKANGQHVSRNKGLLQRIRRLPGRLLGDGETRKSTDEAGESDGSIATSWATFLLTDEADVKKQSGTGAHEEGPQA